MLKGKKIHAQAFFPPGYTVPNLRLAGHKAIDAAHNIAVSYANYDIMMISNIMRHRYLRPWSRGEFIPSAPGSPVGHLSGDRERQAIYEGLTRDCRSCALQTSWVGHDTFFLKTLSRVNGQEQHYRKPHTADLKDRNLRIVYNKKCDSGRHKAMKLGRLIEMFCGKAEFIQSLDPYNINPVERAHLKACRDFAQGLGRDVLFLSPEQINDIKNLAMDPPDLPRDFYLEMAASYDVVIKDRLFPWLRVQSKPRQWAM